MVRGQVTDEHWAIIGPLLPSERGRSCRPALVGGCHNSLLLRIRHKFRQSLPAALARLSRGGSSQ